jgi:arylsulfatase A-like enzyme
MRTIRWLPLLLLSCAAPARELPTSPGPGRPPNFVVIFTDDQGYGDLGCYGAKGFATPNIDRLAREGMRFTSFCVAQAVCSASRAALLTGCYPHRVGIQGALGPRSRVALHHDERTIAEVLKPAGYATAILGKWHLGDHPDYLPAGQGFDEYYGLPYSNDMWPRHPENPRAYPDLPLVQGQAVVALNPDQTKLTGEYARRAAAFIDRNAPRPFFLYLAHSMPHVPLHASEAFRGSSKQGAFGDVIQEIDASVGTVLEALRRNGLDDRTLVVFTCDNGPWLSYGDHAGSAGALREGKGTTFEGGVRVPAIFRWPGKIPAGSVSNELALSMDLLPTFAGLVRGAELPPRPIDGKSLWPILSGQPGAKSPHEAFFCYWGGALEAVRSGPWKLHFPHAYRSLDGKPGGTGGIPAKYVQKRIELSLFNLDDDVGETTDLSARHPEVVERLKALAERAREDLGDTLTQRAGKGLRPSGRVAQARKTEVSIVADAFHINGKPTYAGRTWEGKKIEGLLMNSRMVQGIFDDLNPETVGRWVYPDTKKWDPDRNTREFVAAMPEWRSHGLLSFTIDLQGGNPRGYGGDQLLHNSAITEEGALRPGFMARLERILDKADELGMVAILGVFYFGQDQRLKDEDAVKRALDNAVDWVLDRGYRNVLIEVNNECNVRYDHEILKPARVHELIERVKARVRGGRRLLAGTSYGGGTVSKENVVRASDFLLMHGNGVKDPNRIAEMVRQARAVPGYRPMPILFNEDDHFDFEKPMNNMVAAVSEYASWGYFDPGKNDYADGYQSPPVNWGINTDRKKAFFAKLKEITGP